MAWILQRAANQFFKQQTRSVVSHSAVAGDGGGGVKLWRNISLFIGFPAIALGMLNAYLGHQEESHERPPFVRMDYLRIRTKRFPWGDGKKSLFHNPHVNALPDGYEDEQ